MNQNLFNISTTQWIAFATVTAAFILCFLRIRQLVRIRDDLLKEKDIIYNFIHEVSEIFTETKFASTAQFLEKVLSYALRITSASAGAIYIIEPNDDRLSAKAVSGIFPPLTQEANRQIGAVEGRSEHIRKLVMEEICEKGEGLLGEAAAKGIPMLIEDAERDRRVPGFESDFLKIRTILLVPMRFRHKVLGVIVMINRVDDLPFAESDLNLLQSLADEASVPLHFIKVGSELDRKRMLDSDLRVARKIQESLLPGQPPKLETLEFGAFSLPAREIGGDYYDFVRIDEKHVGIAVADVSGKGITGAMVMSICRSVFRANMSGCLSPGRVLKAMNATITDDIYEDMFISMLYIIINIENFSVSAARAGHMKPFIVKSPSGTVKIIESRGMAIGMTKPEVFDSLLEETSFSLEKGDTLVAFTDGIVEAMNIGQEEWGQGAFHEMVCKYSDAGAGRVVDGVRKTLTDYIGPIPQYDDMTLVVVHRKTSIRP